MVPMRLIELGMGLGYGFYLAPCWTAGIGLVTGVTPLSTASAEDGKRPEQYLIDGAAALAQHLKKWTQRKDVSCPMKPLPWCLIGMPSESCQLGSWMLGA